MRGFCVPLLGCTALLIPLLAACEKQAPPEPTPAPRQESPAPQPAEQPHLRATGGVPQALVDMLNDHWPKIQAEGDAFLARFREASDARGSGDRAKLTQSIEAARGHYNKAKDLWAEVAYWPTNQLDDGTIDQATADRCERWLRSKSSIVKSWDKKAKGLKELSAVR